VQSPVLRIEKVMLALESSHNKYDAIALAIYLQISFPLIV